VQLKRPLTFRHGCRPAFALVLAVSISASSIDLLVAVSGLMEVQDVIGAIRASDAETRALMLGRSPWIEPRRVICPLPQYEPRQIIHPTPQYEARPIYHLTAQLEPTETRGCDNSSPVTVVQKPENESPLEPPWKTVPWKNPPPPAPKVKLTRPHPDICHKGLMLDFFL
jgi:hypothetical protein